MTRPAVHYFYFLLSRWSRCKGRAWWLGCLPWSVESHPEEVEEEKGSIGNKSQGALKSIKWWGIRGWRSETFDVIHQGQARFQTPEKGQETRFQTQCWASGTQRQPGHRWVNFRCDHQHKLFQLTLFTMCFNTTPRDRVYHVRWCWRKPSTPLWPLWPRGFRNNLYFWSVPASIFSLLWDLVHKSKNSDAGVDQK